MKSKKSQNRPNYEKIARFGKFEGSEGLDEAQIIHERSEKKSKASNSLIKAKQQTNRLASQLLQNYDLMGSDIVGKEINKYYQQIRKENQNNYQAVIIEEKIPKRKKPNLFVDKKLKLSRNDKKLLKLLSKQGNPNPYTHTTPFQTQIFHSKALKTPPSPPFPPLTSHYSQLQHTQIRKSAQKA